MSRVFQRRGITGIVILVAALVSDVRLDGQSVPAAAAPARSVTVFAKDSPEETTARRNLLRALATNDPAKWGSEMLDFMNPVVYRRDFAVEIYSSLLDHPDGMVRVTAARYLLELGSAKGVGVLQAALREAATVGGTSVTQAEIAADTLQQYRQPIDVGELYQAYLRTKSPELFEIAIMRQAPELRNVVRQKRARHELGYETERIAAYLGMDDDDSVTYYRQIAAAYPNYRTQLLGHWALFKARGDPADLDYVIHVLREGIGMEPRAERSDPIYGTRERAFEYLSVTLVPAATRALEEIADFVATKPGGNEDDFSRAFRALFYLHHDYAYIDRRLAEFFRGQFKGPGIYRTLMMEIAAARAKPELAALAQVFNPGAYDYDFVTLAGRPVESWYGPLNSVPVDIAPPLPPADRK